MATLTVQEIDKDGAVVTYAAAAGGGDVFANDSSERTFLSIKNGSGGNITVTITAQSTSKTVAGLGVVEQADRALVVTAGTDGMIGPFETSWYNNSSGQVAVTYSGVTSLTVAAVKLLNP